MEIKTNDGRLLWVSKSYSEFEIGISTKDSASITNVDRSELQVFIAAAKELLAQTK